MVGLFQFRDFEKDSKPLTHLSLIPFYLFKKRHKFKSSKRYSKIQFGINWSKYNYWKWVTLDGKWLNWNGRNVKEKTSGLAHDFCVLGQIKKKTNGKCLNEVGESQIYMGFSSIFSRNIFVLSCSPLSFSIWMPRKF